MINLVAWYQAGKERRYMARCMRGGFGSFWDWAQTILVMGTMFAFALYPELPGELIDMIGEVFK